MKGAVITPAFTCHVCLKIGRGGLHLFVLLSSCSFTKKSVCRNWIRINKFWYGTRQGFVLNLTRETHLMLFISSRW